MTCSFRIVTILVVSQNHVRTGSITHLRRKKRLKRRPHQSNRNRIEPLHSQHPLLQRREGPRRIGTPRIALKCHTPPPAEGGMHTIFAPAPIGIEQDGPKSSPLNFLMPDAGVCFTPDPHGQLSEPALSPKRKGKMTSGKVKITPNFSFACGGGRRRSGRR